jgi:hypothetical protein
MIAYPLRYRAPGMMQLMVRAFMLAIGWGDRGSLYCTAGYKGEVCGAGERCCLLPSEE